MGAVQEELRALKEERDEFEQRLQDIASRTHEDIEYGQSFPALRFGRGITAPSRNVHSTHQEQIDDLRQQVGGLDLDKVNPLLSFVQLYEQMDSMKAERDRAMNAMGKAEEAIRKYESNLNAERKRVKGMWQGRWSPPATVFNQPCDGNCRVGGRGSLGQSSN